ncbi:MAG: hypothetical protein ABI790_14425 [Betaproteobacteria bacterium]
MKSPARWLAAFFLAATFGEVHAFAGYVVPARYEIKGIPGQVSRQVLEIGNDAPVPDDYLVKTADWRLTSVGGVEFESGQPRPGSCRPWVKIERHTVKVAARSKRKFRFEVHVPADATAQECRFALMIERASDVLPTVSAGAVQLPLSGRIGVIVYVSIGDIAPKLSVRQLKLGRVNGALTPVAEVENTGNAHGRFEGVLEGSDASGRSMEFTVSNFPILPGETRIIAIWAADNAEGKRPELKPPLKLKGDMEWPGGKWPVNVELK